MEVILIEVLGDRGTAKFVSTMRVPQLLVLKVSNDIVLEADLVLAQ